MLSTVWPNIATYCLCGRHISKKIGTCICTYTHNHTYVYTYPCTYKCIHIHIQYIYGYVKSNSLHYIYIYTVHTILYCTFYTSAKAYVHIYIFIVTWLYVISHPVPIVSLPGMELDARQRCKPQKQSQVASIFSWKNWFMITAIRTPVTAKDEKGLRWSDRIDSLVLAPKSLQSYWLGLCDSYLPRWNITKLKQMHTGTSIFFSWFLLIL